MGGALREGDGDVADVAAARLDFGNRNIDGLDEGSRIISPSAFLTSKSSSWCTIGDVVGVGDADVGAAAAEALVIAAEAAIAVAWKKITRASVVVCRVARQWAGGDRSESEEECGTDAEVWNGGPHSVEVVFQTKNVDILRSRALVKLLSIGLEPGLLLAFSSRKLVMRCLSKPLSLCVMMQTTKVSQRPSDRVFCP